MFSRIALYAAAAMAASWGIAHLFATGPVVRGFGHLAGSNRRILMMEWILEGVSLVWIGALVAVVASVGSESPVSTAVYALSAAGLLAFAVVSLFTGFRVRFLPFRLCPVVFTVAAVLILLAGVFL